MLKKTIAGQLYNLYLKSKEEESIVTLKGVSMSPTFKAGWKVKIKPADAQEISSGDVVVFIQKELVCHRIIGKFRWDRKIFFIHRGDSRSSGGTFEEKDLVGKVVEVTDTEGKKIGKEIWHRDPYSFIKTPFLSYIYMALFLTKRAIFGKRQNRFTRRMKRLFWNLLLNSLVR